MLLVRSEAESSADFAVSQDCILQTDRTSQTVQVNSIGLQIKNLRYSPADAGRRAYGLTSAIEAPEPGKLPKSRASRRIEAIFDFRPAPTHGSIRLEGLV